MSEGAVVRERATSARAEEYLGPAHVLGARGQAVVIELPDGESSEATMALALPYAPAVGDVLLWESWMRHEVPPGSAGAKRISISFNYR